MADPYHAGDICSHYPTATEFQQMLQLAVQSLKWTYGLFWQLCPNQGVLVWAEGYYNGAIRTRKMVQPWEVTEEAASLLRSQQLRELYMSLLSGKSDLQLVSRPSAALSPEDLTEPEWFYLMCMSFTFPPGVGLPGRAYERQQHVWFSRANEAERRVFPRVLLAKTALIQTVVCIPLADGIFEVGTTDKVEEDSALIQHLRSLFIGCHYSHSHNNKPPFPELTTTSNHATPATCQQPHRLPPLLTMHPTVVNSSYKHSEEGERDNDEDDHDGDRATAESDVEQAKPNELIETDMLEQILPSSPDFYMPNNLHSNREMLAMSCITSIGRSDHRRNESGLHNAWSFMYSIATSIDSQSSGDPSHSIVQDMSQDDDEYAQIVSIILQQNIGRQTVFESNKCLGHPQQSAFNSWCCRKDPSLRTQPIGGSQQLLKYILHRVPYLHDGHKNQNLLEERDEEGGNIVQKDARQEEMCTNHVLAERKRREMLNERFLILRSLVPFLTKTDKVSVLGDTIEYIKQLLKRIEDCESQIKLMESENRYEAAEHFNGQNTEESTADVP